jgi:hypothetical protein
LTARLDLAGQALPIRDATALIRHPDGKAESMSLTPGGDGWQATWKPTSPGVYGINLQVSGSAPDGTPLEREASLSVQSQPSANQAVASQRLLSTVVLLVLTALVILIVGSLVKRRTRRPTL